MQNLLARFTQIYNYSFPAQHVAKIATRTYEEGEPILTVGGEIDGFYFLLTGSYYVTSPESNGKELLLRRCTAPSILGDIEIFQQCSIQSNCIATEHCRFLFISTALYEQALQFDANFTRLLLKELSFKLQTCTLLSRVNALSPVSVKLAGYLCTIYAAKSPDDYYIVHNMKDIADLLGTTNRHINRILKKWEDAQIISRVDDSIQIIDLQQLEAISENIRYQ